VSGLCVWAIIPPVVPGVSTSADGLTTTGNIVFMLFLQQSRTICLLTPYLPPLQLQYPQMDSSRLFYLVLDAQSVSVHPFLKASPIA
jgi:hypothetical protein